MIIELALSVITLILVCVFFRGQYNEHYWKKRGIKFLQRNKSLGPFYKFVLEDRAMFDILSDVYKESPDTSSQQYYPPHKAKPKSPCESPAQATLVEQFFNIIFTEFQQTPPVCVCVQMCAGQSTYCYPNGCLKRDNVNLVDSPQSTHVKGASNFMFIVDDKNDMTKSYTETQPEEPKTTTTTREAVEHDFIDIRPAGFKNKYNLFVKHKKIPNIKLKYNLREQVKYMKSDPIRTESFEFSKTRWPQSKPNRHSPIWDPLQGKTNVFLSMLPAGDYAEYSKVPRYSKRDISSTLNSDDPIAKAFYLYENSDNHTENGAETPLSLESLIDNLIKNNMAPKQAEINITDDVKKEPKNESNSKITKSEGIQEPSTIRNAVNVLSLNMTNEIVDKNKYTEIMPITKINQMIQKLSRRIDLQNNTSLELAKNIVRDFDEDKTVDVKSNKNFTTSTGIMETKTENSNVSITTSQHVNNASVAVASKEKKVTKKNRQRRVRGSKQTKIPQN